MLHVVSNFDRSTTDMKTFAEGATHFVGYCEIVDIRRFWPALNYLIFNWDTNKL